MKYKNNPVQLNINFKQKLLSTRVSTLLILVASITTTEAVEFIKNDWTFNFDSSWTIGSSWRVEDRDLALVGQANGGRGWSTNIDDGNRNFDSGDAFSTIFKGVHEFGATYKEDFGVFTRMRYFYDEVLEDNDLPIPLNDTALGQAGSDAQLLDAFVFGSWDFDERYLQLRLGKQVINWGESTFIQHSISEANPLNLSALRVPGAELREGFIPVQSLWTSLDLTDNLSLETYALFDFKPFRFDVPGAYFASNDFIGAGGHGDNIYLGFAQFAEGSPGKSARRIDDRLAKDSGQWGIKLGWFAADLNETEFGFYYVNYHNKRPIISAFAHDGTRINGVVEYIENISLFGLSFNTVLPSNGLSIAGEVSYRQDEPLQIDDAELLFATLEPVGAIPSGTSQIPGGAVLGEEISGYRLFDTVQAQTTFTQLFGPTMGSSEFVVLVEVGANWILDLPDQSLLRFDAPGTARSGNLARSGFEGVETNSFGEDFSWGYRAVTRLDYNNVFAGWNASPRFIFQHDVTGTTPLPIGNFVEGRKSVALGLAMDYQSTWRVDFVYSAFLGGGTANTLSDRDFVSFNFSYSI